MNYLTRRMPHRPQEPLARRGRDRAARSVRSVVVATRETCLLVLDEDSEAVESDQDVSDLLLRLRGHLVQLGPVIDAVSAPADSLLALLDEVRELAWAEAPGDFIKSRVHLRHFARVTHAVLVDMGRIGLVCMHQRECPPAAGTDRAAAHVLLCLPEVGCGRLGDSTPSLENPDGLGRTGTSTRPGGPFRTVWARRRRPVPRGIRAMWRASRKWSADEA
ncbi:DUF6415 family natural product biosynthesis protein [Streptomyces lavendulae]|uniref:DUF6415 family natural product biosynthesis protein n=1 Tax=Streptomyces lavendulae TaxID=1914 RepID=UPI0036A6245C